MKRYEKASKRIKECEEKLRDSGNMSMEEFKDLLTSYKKELIIYDKYYNELSKLMKFIDKTIDI